MRVGMGYDVHRLVEGRDLILGGVTDSLGKGAAGTFRCRCAFTCDYGCTFRCSSPWRYRYGISRIQMRNIKEFQVLSYYSM